MSTRVFRLFSGQTGRFDNETMTNRQIEEQRSPPLLIVSVLLLLLVFVVLHDNSTSHSAPTIESHEGVVEDHAEPHAMALCALLIVGASLVVTQGTSAELPRHSSHRLGAGTSPDHVAWLGSHPPGVPPRLDFCPILA